LAVVLAEPPYVFLKVSEVASPLSAVGHPQMLVLFDRGADLEVALSMLDQLAVEIPSQRYAAERARLQALGMISRERTWPASPAWRARCFFVTWKGM
jgi:hypothetical protein